MQGEESQGTGASPGQGRRRMLYAVALFLALSTVVLVCAEWYLRANTVHFLGPPSGMRHMFEEYAPGKVRTTAGWFGEITLGRETHEYRMNNLGMRGTDVGPKRPGERRVLVLGDSMIWGWGVAAEQAIPARIETLLEELGGPAATVGNGGAPGRGITHQLGAAERFGDSFEPDLVVSSVYLGNDFVDDTLLHHAVVDGYRLSGASARFVESSLRARLTLSWRSAYLLERMFEEHAPFLAMDRSEAVLSAEEIELQSHLPPPAQRGDGLFMDRREMDADLDAILGRAVQTLRSVAELAEPAPVLAVIIPSWAQGEPRAFRDQLVRMKLDPATFEMGITGRRLAERVRGAGLEVVDLSAVFAAPAGGQALWLRGHGHLSAAGSDRVARSIAPVIGQMLER